MRGRSSAPCPRSAPACARVPGQHRRRAAARPPPRPRAPDRCPPRPPPWWQVLRQRRCARRRAAACAWETPRHAGRTRPGSSPAPNRTGACPRTLRIPPARPPGGCARSCCRRPGGSTCAAGDCRQTWRCFSSPSPAAPRARQAPAPAHIPGPMPSKRVRRRRASARHASASAPRPPAAPSMGPREPAISTAQRCTARAASQNVRHRTARRCLLRSSGVGVRRRPAARRAALPWRRPSPAASAGAGSRANDRASRPQASTALISRYALR